ncbi:MAG: dihydrodipicolinate synthase family protein [Planctomycetota bacterium]|nr:dihydrodipicolinate synthase family protein [Planctomycetota bacterium]MEE2883641.1 dihydrodipicolinate synthase family protein [Planctomycetota bacterium]
MNPNAAASVNWAGVMPAVTTPFNQDDEVDYAFLFEHCGWMVQQGVSGIIPCGSLGEGATLSFDEKQRVIDTVVRAVGDRVPVIPGIAAASTREAARFAATAKVMGARGLMVLPPYIHKGPFHEVETHIEVVMEATDLPCMLYNNPIAYGVDFSPGWIASLAQRNERFQAVKDSSGDARRITAIHSLVGDRLALFAGLDDMVVEAVRQGAVGWVAGLVNALPYESVLLFDKAVCGLEDPAVAREADRIYKWFLPLLRLDCVPEFVQLIKLVQQEVARGSERVRPPRFPAVGHLRTGALEVIRETLASNPIQDVEENR